MSSDIRPACPCFTEELISLLQPDGVQIRFAMATLIFIVTGRLAEDVGTIANLDSVWSLIGR